VVPASKMHVRVRTWHRAPLVGCIWVVAVHAFVIMKVVVTAELTAGRRVLYAGEGNHGRLPRVNASAVKGSSRPPMVVGLPGGALLGRNIVVAGGARRCLAMNIDGHSETVVVHVGPGHGSAHLVCVWACSQACSVVSETEQMETRLSGGGCGETFWVGRVRPPPVQEDR
jgi:hypothetical protein